MMMTKVNPKEGKGGSGTRGPPSSAPLATPPSFACFPVLYISLSLSRCFSRLNAFTVSFLLFSVCFVGCCIFSRLHAFLAFPAWFYISFSPLVSLRCINKNKICICVRGFDPPPSWDENPRRFLIHYILESAIGRMRSQ